MAEVRVGGAYIDWRSRNAQFLAGLDKNKRALREQRRALQGLRRSVDRFNAVARQSVRLLGVASVVAAGAAVRAYANLQQTLAQVRGITRATEREFARLNEQALLLGRTTRFTAQQVAEGQLLLARAGLDVGEIIAALPGTLSLAQASAVEVGQAADIVTNALASFRKGADETSRFVDVLAKTTISANTDLIQLADGLKLVAPVAAALGVNVETTAAALGVLSDAGLQATLAGTGLRKVMFDLQNPTGATSRILSDLGLTTEQVSIQQRGLVAVLETLTEAGINATQVIEVFGARGAPAFLNLTAALPRLRELREELLGAAGTARELQRVMDDTLQGAFFRLVSAAEGLGIAIATTTGLGSGLQRSIDSLASGLNSLTDNVQRTLSAVGEAATLVGVLLAGRFVAQTVAAVGALKGLTAGAVALRIGLTALSGPGGWILLAGSALAFLALRLSGAEKETTALARSVNELLNRTEPANVVGALEDSIKRYETRILELREVLERPVTRGAFSRRLITRESIEQFEKDLAALRVRLVEAREDAASGPLTLGTPSASAAPRIGRSGRDIGADARRDIARQARASRQRISLLVAEGAERLKLEARFDVANRFADEQIRLSAALVTAKGEERQSLLAEQAALDESKRSIEGLIAAKREQLEIDQRAAGLAGLQQALAARQSPEQIAFANADEIPGLLEMIREQEEGVEAIAEQWERVQEARRNALESRVDIAAVGINALADGLANAAAHARSLGDALRSIALTVTSSLLRTFLPGLIAGAFGGGINFTPQFSPVSRILPGRQAGGPVAAGQEVIVGEDGPERFRPSVAGNVIPGVGGGVSVSVGPFNIESTDGPGVRAALVDVVPVLRDEVVQAVRQTLRVDARRPSPA